MKTVLIYSGGMDSTVLLYDLLFNRGHEVKCLSINYGQRHSVELEHAKAICQELGVEHRIADLTSLKEFLKGSSQTDDSVEVPEGHYAEESMKLTIVPNRNMLMLAVAAAWAISIKADAIAYAPHAGDHAIYPDCRPEFTEALSQAIALADWHKVELIRPFIGMTKGEVAKLGVTLNVPFEKTWSCYKGGEVHCGKCGTCVERKEALAEAGNDPTVYE